MTADEYAKETLMAQKSKREKKSKNLFESLKSSEEPGKQAPDVTDELSDDEKEKQFDETVKNRAEKFFSGGNQ